MRLKELRFLSFSFSGICDHVNVQLSTNTQTFVKQTHSESYSKQLNQSRLSVSYLLLIYSSNILLVVLIEEK